MHDNLESDLHTQSSVGPENRMPTENSPKRLVYQAKPLRHQVLRKGHLVQCENSGYVDSCHTPHTERVISCFNHTRTPDLKTWIKEKHLKSDSKP